MADNNKTRRIEKLSDTPVASDVVGLLEGMATTRSIRGYTSETVPADVLRDILFAATRAPSGSNRQPFRFLVLTDGANAVRAKALVAEAARNAWDHKRQTDGYDRGSGTSPGSPKARMAKSMEDYIDRLPEVPVLILPCLIRHRAMDPTEGASIYPACQNLLLAARGLGWGGTLTMWHHTAETDLRELLGIPSEATICATITLGRPRGAHGPVRRRPLPDLIFGEQWGRSPFWAIDPPGTRHSGTGPVAGNAEDRHPHMTDTNEEA